MIETQSQEVDPFSVPFKCLLLTRQNTLLFQKCKRLERVSGKKISLLCLPGLSFPEIIGVISLLGVFTKDPKTQEVTKGHLRDGCVAVWLSLWISRCWTGNRAVLV